MPVRLDLELVDSTDGTPVAGASIAVNRYESSLRVRTGVQGHARVELVEKPPHLSLHVRRDGYVPKLVTWDLDLVRVTWPEQFTLKMDRAHTIGGIVRNERGEPVAGVHVLVTLRGSSSHGTMQPRIYTDIWERPVKTDAEGRWQYRHAPGLYEHIMVRLAHPDYVSNVHLPSPPPPEDFWKGTAVLKLQRGLPCEGTVTDGEGRPVSGVRVTLGEAGNGSDSKACRRTDAQGRFRFGGISFENYGEPQILSFRKRGFAPEMVTLQPASTVVRGDAVLGTGTALRLRFAAPDGTPVPDVMVALHGWRNHRPFGFCFRADDEGLAVWENAPSDAAQYSIMPRRSFQREELSLTATSQVQIIVLRRPLSISGRVIDARTKQPIPKFSLVRGAEYDVQRGGERIYWNHHWTRFYENGEYRANVGDAVISRHHDGTIHSQGYRRIRVSAPGYAPAASRRIANDETEDIGCDFELEPANEITCLVKDASGQPVAGAEMAVESGGNPVFISGGRIHHRGGLQFVSDAEGRFTLQPQEKDCAVVIVHPAAGYRIISCHELENTAQVVLLPWARLELLTTSEPGEPPLYHVHYQDERRDERPPAHFTSKGVMRKAGVLIFEGLPAGKLLLYTRGMPMLEEKPIMIDPGQTLRLDHRTGRRAIIGRFALPPEGISTEERLTHLTLRRRWPPSILPRQNRGDYFEVHFRVDLAGKFRIDDIAPGLYQVAGIFFRTRTEGEAQPDVAGLGHKEFEMPEGNDAFDVGIIPILPPDGLQWKVCKPGDC